LLTGKLEILVIGQDFPLLNKEALRVIGLMPEWEPLIIGGILCDSHHTQPINFILQEWECRYFLSSYPVQITSFKKGM